MTAIAGHARPVDEARAGDDVRSAWRAPLFYFAVVAAALLLIAVGLVLLCRVVNRGGRF